MYKNEAHTRLCMSTDRLVAVGAGWSWLHSNLAHVTSYSHLVSCRAATTTLHPSSSLTTRSTLRSSPSAASLPYLDVSTGPSVSSNDQTFHDSSFQENCFFAFNAEKCRYWEGRKSSAGAHTSGGLGGIIKRCPEPRPTLFLACNAI